MIRLKDSKCDGSLRPATRIKTFSSRRRMFWEETTSFDDEAVYKLQPIATLVLLLAVCAEL